MPDSYCASFASYVTPLAIIEKTGVGGVHTPLERTEDTTPLSAWQNVRKFLKGEAIKWSKK